MSAKAKNKLTPQQRKATLNRVLHKIRPYSIFVVCSLLVAAVSVAAQLYIPILCGDAIDKMLGKGNVDLAGVLRIAVRILVVAAGWLTHKKNWKRNRMVIFPMASFYLGFLLNIAAPGNWVRAEGASGMNPIKAVFISLLYGLEYCMSQWTDWTVIMMFLLLIPLFWRAVVSPRSWISLVFTRYAMASSSPIPYAFFTSYSPIRLRME